MTFDRNTNQYSGQLASGAEVYGADNEKIGRLVQAGPNFLLIEKGWLFVRDLYLPTNAIERVDRDRVYLTYTKAEAEGMGREELPTEGDTWYGNERTGTATAAPYAETGRTADRMADRTATTGRTARGSEEISVPVVEEQLKAGVREREAGRARVVKDVREEQQSIDVPVEREEVYITERAVNRPATEADLRALDRDVEIPLREQEVVTQKQAVVTGEVNVRKETRRDTERVTDTVRREDVHVEDPNNPRVHVEGEAGTARGTGSKTRGTGGAGKTVTDQREYDAQGNLVDERHREDPGTVQGR
jgi:uncharacterized protein (TIGR02271 family)